MEKSGNYYIVVFFDNKNEVIEMEVLYVSPISNVENTAWSYANEQNFDYDNIKYKFYKNSE